MRWLRVCLLAVGFAGSVRAQTDAPTLVTKMVANEDAAEQHRGRYVYLSEERSERTGGHLWTERVAETEGGKVRLLLAEDGRPLTADRQAAERAKLQEIAAHPEAFTKREQALKNDERHAKELLELLPKAFLFDAPVKDGAYLRIAFRPNPAYTPTSMEERVLHSMVGTVVVDPAVRLHGIEGRLPEDVSIGFGLVATIKAGSHFSTTRERVAGDEWKTAVLDTDIDGRAIFFKAIGKKEHAEHREFKLMGDAVTVPQGVGMLLR